MALQDSEARKSIQGLRSHRQSHATCAESWCEKGDRRRLRRASGVLSRRATLRHLQSCAPYSLPSQEVLVMSEEPYSHLEWAADCGSPGSLRPTFAP